MSRTLLITIVSLLVGYGIGTTAYIISIDDAQTVGVQTQRSFNEQPLQIDSELFTSGALVKISDPADVLDFN